MFFFSGDDLKSARHACITTPPEEILLILSRCTSMSKVSVGGVATENELSFNNP